MIRIFFGISVSFALALPAYAQMEDSPRDFVASLSRQAPVIDAVFRDMDGDGFEEALVRFDECAQDRPTLCTWMVGARTPTGWTIVGGSQAENATFLEAENGSVVVSSDGVHWLWDGDILLPGLGLLYEATSRRASEGEVELVSGISGYDDLSRMSLGVYDLDLTGNNLPERVFIVNDIAYMIGVWGTPYLVVNESGALITEGFSADLPRIFRRPGGGFSIIEIGPVSMSEIIIE